MNAIINKDGIVNLEQVRDFDPEQTFLCGQCFRWELLDDGCWNGSTGSHRVKLLHEGLKVTLKGTSGDVYNTVWLPYFDFDSDYSIAKSTLSDGDEVMALAIEHGQGIRLLRQEPWETLATFLISQNNGIPRIRKIVETLCVSFGERGTDPGQISSFPSAERIASLNEDDLTVCRAGYRTEYLLRTARAISEGEVVLSELAACSYEEARNRLLRLHGVGVKVADCTLLFSGLHREAFPVDRWVLRVMNALYPGSGADVFALQTFAAKKWGKLAGLAQEYLFYYARMKRIGV